MDRQFDVLYITLKNSLERNPDVRQAMLPCAHILGHSNAGEVGADPTQLPVLQPASETPRYCAGASLEGQNKPLKQFKTKLTHKSKNNIVTMIL